MSDESRGEEGRVGAEAGDCGFGEGEKEGRPRVSASIGGWCVWGWRVGEGACRPRGIPAR